MILFSILPGNRAWHVKLCFHGNITKIFEDVVCQKWKSALLRLRSPQSYHTKRMLTKTWVFTQNLCQKVYFFWCGPFYVITDWYFMALSTKYQHILSFLLLFTCQLLTQHIFLILTLKAPIMTGRRHFQSMFFVVFRGNNAWYYMWIVCWADDSHVMSSIIFPEK